MSDDFCHTLNIRKDFVVPESQNLETLASQPCISSSVLAYVFCMLTTIDLYD